MLLKLVIAIVVVAPAVAATDPPSPALARSVATRFIGRLHTRNINGSIALCDAPFITHEQQTLGTITEVRNYLFTMTSTAPPDQQPNTILSVRSYAETRKETADDVLRVRDPVLKEGGYVVFVGRAGKLRGVLLVRVKNGFAKVVGIG